ncbi:hypothetical protein METBIDRAFT_42965 [Metschnikowia bicuspidata var. bicuspidata NRRL YB-4993]|uniref:DNA-binding protein RAP1 n=1 Tax=Metschnikowia bicuspidata var. bicuspidata NRRL YB-4993 TaxID=869754 RepID=A0A1A0H9L5_9ASCO|nr:hypothetical protein METBIDRAFT_42965 [Metschnikowia bicuspidata var. bicuspidata NRRL YB-4993]OBA20577.1 hypothetical protein METBIDRAFT_42965 [Metschnikowia bicuspidata var. bicuspidata NRRL YB-4993]
MTQDHQIITNRDLVPHSLLSNLFPHLLYIDPLEPNYEHYCRVIQDNGGQITADHNNTSAHHLSSTPWPDRPTYLLLYVDHSIRNNTQQILERYRFLLSKRRNSSYDEEGLHAIDVSNSSSSTEPGVKRPRDKLTKNTTKFTPEADAYILEQVRMRPRLRTSHKFFEELAKHDTLKGHTGNSVRSRYRAHLEHKLQYVFKTDNYDNLILDENGQKIAVEVSQAKTMKNKFTAEDDFHLCEDVITHVAGIQNNHAANGTLDEDKFSVLIAFFDEYARRFPQHSSSSWRDRYRKFARPHGLQRYRDEYIRDLNTKEGPKPMKNMTSRKDRDKSQNKNGHHSTQLSHLDHHIDSEMGMTSRETDALDEEIGAVKNSNIDSMLRSIDAGDMSAIHPDLTSGGVDADVEAIDLSLRQSMSQEYSRGYQYMPSNVTLNDLFSDQFYRQKSEQIMTKLKECLTGHGTMTLEKISETLQSFGFTKKFVGHVFRVTSGSALPMIRYFGQVLTLLENEKTNDMQEILYLHDGVGFWTPEADEALMRGEMESLRHMKEADINQRRVFLGLED